MKLVSGECSGLVIKIVSEWLGIVATVGVGFKIWFDQ